MEDIFYLSKEKIEVEVLHQLFVDAGYQSGWSSMVLNLGPGLIVKVDGKQFEFMIILDQKASMPLDTGPQQTYDKINPSTLIIISYRYERFQTLKEIMKLVLSRFGGYVACDDDWDVLYELETIDQLKCIYE